MSLTLRPRRGVPLRPGRRSARSCCASTRARGGSARPARSGSWEGGGEYNVARGLRRCFGLRTGDRHRLADNDGRPAGRGPDPPGRGRHVASSAGCPYDGVGRDGAQRAQLHRARVRRPRRGRRAPTAGTPRRPSCGRATSTGSTSSARSGCAGSTPAASSPALSDTTPDVVAEAMAAARTRTAPSSRTT